MEFGVVFDTWFPEQTLFEDGAVAHVIKLLEQKDYLYQKDGARWFRSSDFFNKCSLDNSSFFLHAHIPFLLNWIISK